MQTLSCNKVTSGDKTKVTLPLNREIWRLFRQVVKCNKLAPNDIAIDILTNGMKDYIDKNKK